MIFTFQELFQCHKVCWGLLEKSSSPNFRTITADIESYCHRWEFSSEYHCREAAISKVVLGS
jgi:hypothetical protein